MRVEKRRSNGGLDNSDISIYKPSASHRVLAVTRRPTLEGLCSTYLQNDIRIAPFCKQSQPKVAYTEIYKAALSNRRTEAANRKSVTVVTFTYRISDRQLGEFDFGRIVGFLHVRNAHAQSSTYP